MGPTNVIIFFFFFKTCLSSHFNDLFNKINEDTKKYNAQAASIAWESSVNPGNPELPRRSARYQKDRIMWQQRICGHLATLFRHYPFNETQKRQSYLLCRGPKFTFEEARLTSDLLEELQSTYSEAEICIPVLNPVSSKNLNEIEDAILNYLSNVKQVINHGDPILISAKTAVKTFSEDKSTFCFKGEDFFDKMMKFSRKEEVLRWLWLVWREKVGPPMKEPYKKLVAVENQAAKRDGHDNIGVSWREELEIPDLRNLSRKLYYSIRPLYDLLHGVVRYYLRINYGEMVPERGPIPAHLLGNLWSQNWESLTDLIIPRTLELDQSIKKMNWTVMHMVRRVDDFYQSMGLPAMTDTFWQQSIFSRENNTSSRCHGTAADMFQDGDFRLLYCSETTKEDFYVLHHEFGHIQYYMAYEQQPTLFRQANSAFHETIGDTIMYGVLTPQHLNRLGLINDSLLYTTIIPKKKESEKIIINKKKEDFIRSDILKENNDANMFFYDNIDTFNNKLEYESILKPQTPKLIDEDEVTTDLMLMLKQALNKIPQIPFALLIDEYRWKYFEGEIIGENIDFWNMVLELQGVAPPGVRGEEYFDIGAKFHVPDNTPYIRYFLSSFLQHQLFEKLCKAAVYGRRSADEDVPPTITLTRCDLYGSKAAGKVLKDFMSRGNSQHWSVILKSIVGDSEISADALNKYYQPLYELLDAFVKKHRIPIGW